MNKELFKQNEAYGCGLYAIANALMAPHFITEKRLLESKYGNTLFQLNQYIQEDFPNVAIETLFYDCWADSLPSKWSLPSAGNDGIMPLILDARKGIRPHLVGAHLTPSGELIILDSLRDELIYTDWEDISKHYFVRGVHGFMSLPAMRGEGDTSKYWSLLSEIK